MKIPIYTICLLALFSCSSGTGHKRYSTNNIDSVKPVEHNIKSYTDELRISISATDTIDVSSDSTFGVGDDNLFSHKEFRVFNSKNAFNEIAELNDYNLLTCYRNNNFDPIKGPDTLNILIDYSDFPNAYPDTAFVITSIDIFNGDRKSLKKWSNSTKIKDVEVYYQHSFIGRAKLNNTFKMQSIYLEREGQPLPIYGYKTDTITILVKSIYDNNGSSKGYSLSEIKFDGYKMKD